MCLIAKQVYDKDAGSQGGKSCPLGCSGAVMSMGVAADSKQQASKKTTIQLNLNEGSILRKCFEVVF